MTTEIRRHFRQSLQELERDLVQMSEQASAMVGMAVEALITGDADLAQRVVDSDDAVDGLYLKVHETWLALMAQQTPVAADLRLMAAILHVNSHLERIADLAVNVAKITRSIQGLPTSQVILSHIQEMGDVVRPMIAAGMDAFVRRDLDLALRLPELDGPVNRLNRNMYRDVAACYGDPRLLDWAVPMLMVSRNLERVGDNSVDIGEQVAFLLTGEVREFTDASRPMPPDA